jgi:hypothetical protein
VIAPTQRRPRRRRGPWLPWLAALLAVVFLLAVGISIGMALEDNPQPDLTVTTTKTLVP